MLTGSREFLYSVLGQTDLIIENYLDDSGFTLEILGFT